MLSTTRRRAHLVLDARVELPAVGSQGILLRLFLSPRWCSGWCKKGRAKSTPLLLFRILQVFYRAAGLGFEPRLTDPESVFIHPWLFAGVQKTAYLSQISGSRVSRCSPLFTPVTVKALSKQVPRTLQLCFQASAVECRVSDARRRE